ncbi:Cytochrome P450 [Neofusicoccum parvum]|uniref:Cytochrome P450 n=1 Tax=Neofusicoccum parvum TaxID=310453 RepID=A0ACB5SE90_9PEZI|nr:Cytochrome P450 [Neofusicoccum parvum]
MQAKTFRALWAAIAFVLLKIVTLVTTRKRHATLSRELGCKPTPIAEPGDVFGISTIRQLMKASNEYRLPDFIIERMKNVSEREGRHVTTIRHVVLGEQNVFTYEPKNVQTVLATKFKDFELGERRVGNFHPLLGDGIFASNNFKKQCRSVHAFIDYFVQLVLSKGLALDHQQKSITDTDKKKEGYVFLNALAAQTRDPIELRNQLLNILLAGRDTTASLLSWLFLLLAKHPDIYIKLRRSVVEDFGTYAAPEEITYTGLKNCSYLQHTIAEPERWQGRKVGWEYLPFNGGPRIYIGQEFTLTEASYVVVRLLQRFDMVEGVGVVEPFKHGLTLTDCPAQGVNVTLREAKE